MTAADVTVYITARQAAKAANATINRELAALKKAYSLALAAERIHRAPRFRMLQEDNVRQASSSATSSRPSAGSCRSTSAGS